MSKCNICGEELLEGLIMVGLHTCLKCRDLAAYQNSLNNKNKKSTELIEEIDKIYDRHEGYIGNVGGYE